LSKFFITGASGFIGKKLVSALNFDSNSITVLSRNNQAGFKTVICDLQSEFIPDNSLNGIDVVFHLAGVAHDLSNKNEKYYDVNVKATINLAKLAVKSGVKKFIFISSVKANNDITLNKDLSYFKKYTQGDYGKSKREAEIHLLEIGKNSNLEVSIIRPSLVYGPHVKGNLKLMLSGIKKGWFPPIPEANNRKSMVHVDDLIDAIILVTKDHRVNNEIFIVSDGHSYTSRQIYNCLCIASDRSIPKWQVPRFFFTILAFISQKLRHKIDKLIGDDYYPSSDKIVAMGYTPKKSLKDINFSKY
jgi:UDP-glucose 4-epimerase